MGSLMRGEPSLTFPDRNASEASLAGTSPKKEDPSLHPEVKTRIMRMTVSMIAPMRYRIRTMAASRMENNRTPA